METAQSHAKLRQFIDSARGKTPFYKNLVTIVMPGDVDSSAPFDSISCRMPRNSAVCESPGLHMMLSPILRLICYPLALLPRSQITLWMMYDCGPTINVHHSPQNCGLCSSGLNLSSRVSGHSDRDRGE